MFLTVFLLSAGLFTVFAALANWGWFFANEAAAPIVAILGRRLARLAYVIVGLALTSIAVFRVLSPPLTVTDTMLMMLTHPLKHSLLEDPATSELQTASGVQNLSVIDGKWMSFSLVMDSMHPLYPLLSDTDTFSVDMQPGFLFRGYQPHPKARATIFYFNARLTPCDNWLMSRTPLDSAEFVVLVWDAAASRLKGVESGLLAEWHRRDSKNFKSIVRR